MSHKFTALRPCCLRVSSYGGRRVEANTVLLCTGHIPFRSSPLTMLLKDSLGMQCYSPLWDLCMWWVLLCDPLRSLFW